MLLSLFVLLCRTKWLFGVVIFCCCCCCCCYCCCYLGGCLYICWVIFNPWRRSSDIVYNQFLFIKAKKKKKNQVLTVHMYILQNCSRLFILLKFMYLTRITFPDILITKCFEGTLKNKLQLKKHPGITKVFHLSKMSCYA
jgi:hypothetical protein